VQSRSGRNGSNIDLLRATILAGVKKLSCVRVR